MLLYIFLLCFLVILWLLKNTGIFFKKTNITNDKVAVIMCSKPNDYKFEYLNIRDCNLAIKYFERNLLCKEGCIGLYSCIDVCPFGAIDENLNVISEKCCGCDECAKACPLNLIKLVKRSEKIYIKCKTLLNSTEAQNICVKGCLRCYICLDICSNRAIYLDDNHFPIIDQNKCSTCNKCVMKCPAGVIKSIYSTKKFNPEFALENEIRQKI